ncbi:MAG TPA: VOC family protein [Anaeromyxobacteraceae bacterium]|jgi:catechol 2,3-dioxygenase-like lactoylglutathione lyase family enzyme
MIDHMTLTVRDLPRSKAFYEKALAPLGYAVQMDFAEVCGFGPPHKPAFWLKQGDPPTQPMHIAFVAADRPAVDAFHAAALAGGATDDGAPGLREQYHPNYYGGFVKDPDGHPIEAVCHRPPGPPARKAARRKAPARVARRGAGRRPRRR